MGPLKILGWHTKTKSHNLRISLYCCSKQASRKPVENYRKDLGKHILWLVYCVIFNVPNDLMCIDLTVQLTF